MTETEFVVLNAINEHLYQAGVISPESKKKVEAELNRQHITQNLAISSQNDIIET